VTDPGTTENMTDRETVDNVTDLTTIKNGCDHETADILPNPGTIEKVLDHEVAENRCDSSLTIKRFYGRRRATKRTKPQETEETEKKLVSKRKRQVPARYQ
jgi:hypothetical protein